MTAIRTLLVLGGARSGKTRLALSAVEAASERPVMIATATAGDGEMADRIARHRAERGPRWRTIEETVDLADALRAADTPGAAVVVDCLTLWLSNLTFGGHDVEALTEDVVLALQAVSVPVVFVSNEIGLGLVPDTPLGRRFRDAQGRLNQRMAQACDAAVFVAAGLPLVLKPEGERFSALRLGPSPGRRAGG